MLIHVGLQVLLWNVISVRVLQDQIISVLHENKLVLFLVDIEAADLAYLSLGVLENVVRCWIVLRKQWSYNVELDFEHVFLGVDGSQIYVAVV